jgi:hypothetical protein
VNNDALGRPLRWVLSKLLAGQGPTAGIPDATRPALVASFWIERRLFGSEPAGYHVDSLLLYIAVCCLATAATFVLTRRRRVALVAGLVFTLAPIHSEAVAAIHYREDLISAAGILCPIVWLCSPRGERLQPSAQIAISIVWAVGLFGKESAVALIPMLLVVFAFVPKTRAAWRRNEGAFFALGGTLLVWLNWRGALLLAGDDVPRAARGSVVSTLLSTARFESRAVGQSLWPFAWAPEYSADREATWVWSIAFIAIVAAVLVLARQPSTRTLALGIALSVAAALPTSPLVGPINARADRYLFVSAWGGALAWGWAADRLGRFIHRRWHAAALAVVSLALVVACRRATAPWRDDLSLWSVATDRAPESARAWTGLSRARRLRGDLPGATKAVDTALSLDPRFVPAHVTKAYTLLALGEPLLAQIELDRLRSEGNGSYRGVSRALRCARLSPNDARTCIKDAR